MIRKSKASEVEVVRAVAERTRQAAELAAISGQERLADPRTNPAVRGLADELRDEQQRQMLRAEHSRLLRRHRVADRRAAEAERALEALALAREASSPARSVLALHTGRRLYLRVSMAASVVLAAGSAMGVEKVATETFHAPTGSGYIAEVGLTGLATLAIHYRAHLTSHGGTLVKRTWQNRVLWALMTVPLLLSVVANLAKTNAIGAACAIGAAAFSALAWVIADRSAAAMQDRAAEVSAQDEAELERAAMGDDLFSAPQGDAEGNDGDGQVDPVAVEAGRGVAEVEAWLADQQDGPDGGVAAGVPSPDGSGPHGAAAEVGPDDTAERVDRGSMRPRVHIDGDQPDRVSGEGPDGAGGARRVLPAAQARRALGASTRHRISQYLTEHPGASHAQVARALKLSEDTVKRHRRALRKSGGEVS